MSPVEFVTPDCRRYEHGRCEWSADAIAGVSRMLGWPCACPCHSQPDLRGVEPYASAPDETQC